MFAENAKISFDKDNLFLCAENKKIFAQPLSDYPKLMKASVEQRANWKLSKSGIRWEEIDEDISFESFLYGKDDPLVVKMH